MIWKIIFDAKHSLGRYYGRVTFVEANGRDDALERGHYAASVEFPGHAINVVDLGESTPEAKAVYDRKVADAVAWRERNKLLQVTLCEHCHGTGRRDSAC